MKGQELNMLFVVLEITGVEPVAHKFLKKGFINRVEYSIIPISKSGNIGSE